MLFRDKFQANKELLIVLSKCQKKLRNSIIENASKDNINSICECILNVSNGNVHINQHTYKKLKPFSKTFKKLLDRKTKIKDKKQLIIQKGGFLQFLIPAIVSGIASIISSTISSNKSEPSN